MIFPRQSRLWGLSAGPPAAIENMAINRARKPAAKPPPTGAIYARRARRAVGINTMPSGRCAQGLFLVQSWCRTAAPACQCRSADTARGADCNGPRCDYWGDQPSVPGKNNTLCFSPALIAPKRTTSIRSLRQWWQMGLCVAANNQLP